MKKIGKYVLVGIAILTFLVIKGYYKQKKEMQFTTEKEKAESEIRKEVIDFQTEMNKGRNEINEKLKNGTRKRNNCEFARDENNLLLTKPLSIRDNKTVIEISSYKINDTLGISLKFTSKDILNFNKDNKVKLVIDSKNKITLRIDEIGKRIEHKKSGLFINNLFAVWDKPDFDLLIDNKFKEIFVESEDRNILLTLDGKGKLSSQIQCVYF